VGVTSVPGLTRICLSLACLLLVARPAFTAADPASSVKDLQYGEALYHYFQKDYFNSIVRLQIAQQQQRLPSHAREAELLLGGLDLSYGLRNEARRIFQALLDDRSTDDSTRNRAWYYLARISYERNDLPAALQAIGHIEGEMTPATRTAALNLHSLLLMEQGDYSAAIGLLQDARSGKHWAPFLNYNLGIALIRDQQQQRGIRQLDQLGEMRADTEEQRLLRDKANLALGYSYLRDEEPASSRKALERVRLEGPLSNKALLGTGWADAENGDFATALVPWMELGQRDKTDPAVQESLLAIPYAMTRMNLHGRAVQQYNTAIDLLISEREKLGQSILAIQQGDLQDILLEEGLGAGNGWMQQLYLDSGAPALRYQLALMSSHDFQEAIKNYRDLVILKSNLARWSNDMPAYDDMLAGRQTRFGTYRPAADGALHDTRLQVLRERRDSLAAELVAIGQSNDAIGLSSPREFRQLQKLDAIGQSLQRLPDTPETHSLREKQQRLHGILVWQIHQDYKPRLRVANRQLAELDTLLADADQANAGLQDTRRDGPGDFSGFRVRITTQRNTLTTLETRTDGLLRAQGQQLDRLAIAELKQQQQRIDTYIIQARFALAQTYDSALQQPANGETVQ
jgi:hypothetical protein